MEQRSVTFASLAAGVVALAMSAPAHAQMIGMRHCCAGDGRSARRHAARPPSLRTSTMRSATPRGAWRAATPLTIVAIGSSSTAGAGATFAGGKLSEPPCRRTRSTFPRARHHGAQSRRQRRRDRADAGAVRNRRHCRASGSGALAGRHQFRFARSSAQIAFRPVARGHLRSSRKRASTWC